MKKFKLLSMLMFILTIAVVLLTACGSKGYRSIKVFSIDGSVSVEREGKTLNASKNMKLKNNDTVTVSTNSSTVLKLDSDKFVMAKENTTLKLEATGKKNNTKTRILVSDGGVIIEVKEKLKDNESFEIASSNSVMAIRGTQIGFDVSNDNGVVSTNLVTLTGKTEISLLKDDNLKSTNLTECLSLTYESSASDSKDIVDMSQLIDNSTIGHISDSDLEKVYNTEIREISTYEIDSIVDAVNTFERKPNEYINGTIKILEHPDTVTYGVDPKEYIRVDKDYEELNFYYSKTIKGDYLKFDEDNPLTPGIWYCKAKSIDAYRSDPFEFSVVEKEIKFNKKPESVDYGVNPKTIFTLDDNYKDVDYYYSSTIDGEYKLYNENDPLDLGTYYFYAKCPVGYISKTYTLEVSKIKVDFKFDIVQKSYVGTASLDITLDKDIKVFDQEFAAEAEEVGKANEYKYYVSLTYKDNEDILHTIYFDKAHKNEVLDYVFTGENNIILSIDYNLPYYYEVISNETLPFSFKNSIDMDKSVILCVKGNSGNMVRIFFDNYYYLDYDSEVKIKIKKVAPFTGEVTYIDASEIEDFSHNYDGCYYIPLDGDATLAIETYEYDESSGSKKGYYEYDLDFSQSHYSITTDLNCNNTFFTYNDNNTMNAYFDIDFFPSSADVMYFATITTNDGDSYQTYMALGNNKRFVAYEDIKITSYHAQSVFAVVKYNGVYYGIKSGDTSNLAYYDLDYISVQYKEYDNGITLYPIDTNIDVTNPIVIHTDDSINIVPDNYCNGYSFNEYSIEGAFNDVTCDITIYSAFSKYPRVGGSGVAFDLDGNPEILDDETFITVKEQMLSKYDITVKGSNKHTIYGIKAVKVSNFD